MKENVKFNSLFEVIKPVLTLKLKNRAEYFELLLWLEQNDMLPDYCDRTHDLPSKNYISSINFYAHDWEDDEVMAIKLRWYEEPKEEELPCAV